MSSSKKKLSPDQEKNVNSSKKKKKSHRRSRSPVDEIRETKKFKEGKDNKEAKDVETKDIINLDEVEDIKEVLPYNPALQGSRTVEEFTYLTKIEEGTYGVVFKAINKRTHETVALKKVKMENENDGFPITSLREINLLLKARHENIVNVKEIVVGSDINKIYIVMEYLTHDMKSFMEKMKTKFQLGEIKTLMIQLLRAIAFLHDNWILHRDLKTTNLLMSDKGILKVGDFGLAREYGSPLKKYTSVVVTLWYRSPELLLQSKEYSCPIDVWSIGCIFGEFLNMKPIFRGKSEIDQLNIIFEHLGKPNEKIWPGYSELPLVKKIKFEDYKYNNLKKIFFDLPESGFELANRLLTYCPEKRITAESALKSNFFLEDPPPVEPIVFTTLPLR